MKPEVGVGLPLPPPILGFSDSSLPSLRDFPSSTHPLCLGAGLSLGRKGPLSLPSSPLLWPEGGQKMPQCG